jgi:hypothetical protein
MAAVLALLSIAGCAQYIGKGKASAAARYQGLRAKSGSEDKHTPQQNARSDSRKGAFRLARAATPGRL